MQRALFALILVVCGPAICAQAGPVGSSADCKQALAAMRSREDTLLAARQPGRPPDPPDATLLELRRTAARACLVRGVGPLPPLQRTTQPAAQPASAAPTPTVVPVAVPQPSPVLPAGPVIAPAGPPSLVTACDSGGCWTSDGTRLNRVGSNLVGPQGHCSLVGAYATCP